MLSHAVHPKFITVLYVNYISIKLKEINVLFSKGLKLLNSLFIQLHNM